MSYEEILAFLRETAISGVLFVLAYFLFDILSRRSNKLFLLKMKLQDMENALERAHDELGKAREKHIFETRLLQRLTEAVFDRGAWTYSPGVFDLMKTINIRRSLELGYSGTALEISLSPETTPDEANTMLGEAIFRRFGQPIPEQGNLFALANSLMKEEFGGVGFRPTVFIRIMQPLRNKDMGRSGFAGSIRGACEARRIVLVVLSPPEGVGTFLEALVNLSQF